jgi:hypothetical protein
MEGDLGGAALERSIADSRWKRVVTKTLIDDIVNLVSESEGMSDQHFNCARQMRDLLLDKLKADIDTLIAQRDK